MVDRCGWRKGEREEGEWQGGREEGHSIKREYRRTVEKNGTDEQSESITVWGESMGSDVSSKEANMAKKWEKTRE